MWDIATDPVTGDWVFSANRDIQHVEGDQVIAQRIRHRLRIARRAWELDPSDGALGSRLEEALRLPRGRVIREMRLMVDEALAPMSDDIEIIDVRAIETGLGGLKVEIDYVVTEDDTIIPFEERLLNTLTYELP